MDATTSGIGFFLRAPGLVVLAAVFLVEGYRWLGIIHIGSTAVGSVVFGAAGLALTALCAPVAAAVLTSGRQTPGWVEVEDFIVVVAVAVTVTTGTAQVVGGSTWRDAAGTADLLLAASALGAVLLGEHARGRSAEIRPSRVTTSR